MRSRYEANELQIGATKIDNKMAAPNHQLPTAIQYASGVTNSAFRRIQTPQSPLINGGKIAPNSVKIIAFEGLFQILPPSG